MREKFRNITRLVREVRNFPIKTVTLGSDPDGKNLYASFNSRHPKLFLVKKKTIGVALIDKLNFPSAEAYLKSVNGKNSAAYFSRKAVGAGCHFEEIDPTIHAEGIHEIHLSQGSRQGREMDDSYKTKITDYPVNDHNAYYGVFKDDKLVAYLWIVKSGELMLMNRIMGHSNFLDHGIMYLLVTSFVQLSYGLKQTVIMYDTLLGGTDGLKMFKKRCGFKPYRVKWNQTL